MIQGRPGALARMRRVHTRLWRGLLDWLGGRGAERHPA